VPQYEVHTLSNSGVVDPGLACWAMAHPEFIVDSTFGCVQKRKFPTRRWEGKKYSGWVRDHGVHLAGSASAWHLVGPIRIGLAKMNGNRESALSRCRFRFFMQTKDGKVHAIWGPSVSMRGSSSHILLLACRFPRAHHRLEFQSVGSSNRGFTMSRANRKEKDKSSDAVCECRY
jgi:hypothetical protein